MSRPLVLVDHDDKAIGTGDKLPVHRAGLLHRAFSIFVFDQHGRLLLQRRAFQKYHSGGLWSNTCCSHPGPNEPVSRAAARRLEEEMGFSSPLRPLFQFVYRAELDNGFIEHEYDHVFAGVFTGDPAPDPEEVAAWKWMHPSRIAADLRDRSQDYTFWFNIAFQRLLEHPPIEMKADTACR